MQIAAAVASSNGAVVAVRESLVGEQAARNAPSPRPAPAMGNELLVSGMSVSGASAFTNPFDVIKTRLQLQQHGQGDKPTGLLRTGTNLVRDEGFLSLWKGLTPAVARGFVYGGMRLGLYKPCKELVSWAANTAAPAARHAAPGGQAPSSTSTSTSFAAKALAGSLSGGLAAALTSPTELVKTRLQAKGSTAKGSIDVMRQVVQLDGIRGLWRGAVPGLVRASLLTASQCATYDEAKQLLLARSGLPDSLLLHLMASMATGLVTTTVTNPADVVKTRMFVGGQAQGGMVSVAMAVLRERGPAGFLSGWLANYARLGPQTVLIFVFSENLRRMFGMQPL